MSLLETISIRLFNPNNAHLIKKVFSQVEQGAIGVESPQGASLFSSCSVPGDWTMQLAWPGNGRAKAKTVLGKQLANSFRSIGLVHHTIWQSYSAAMPNNQQQDSRGEQHEA